MKMMELTTPPLSPKVVQILSQNGIMTLEDLKKIGACAAFLLLKKSHLSVTQSVFKQLVLLEENKKYEELDDELWQQWQNKLKSHPPVACFPRAEEMHHFMRLALKEAQLAASIGEVPVGAVVVHQGEVIASAYNRCVHDCNISHHAEIQALAQAGQKLNNYRLMQCDVYITLEPCCMCASALIQARVGRVIYAAQEPKTGAAGSVLDLFANKTLNNHTAVLGGVLAVESQDLLQDFFQSRRKRTIK